MLIETHRRRNWTLIAMALQDYMKDPDVQAQAQRNAKDIHEIIVYGLDASWMSPLVTLTFERALILTLAHFRTHWLPTSIWHERFEITWERFDDPLVC